MRPRPFLLSLLVLCCFVTALLFARERAGAVGENVVYVSGLHVGKGRTALVRVHNPAPTLNGTWTLSYLIRETESGRPMSRLGVNVEVRGGETLELDLGEIVEARRAEFGLTGRFDGPVQFVAFNSAEFTDPFGPDTAIVTAIQQDGKATFRAPVVWQSQL